MSFILHSTRVSMQVFASEFTDNIGAIVLSLLIAIGGIIAGWILIWIAEHCTRTPSSKRWSKLDGSNKWKEGTRRSSRSIVRLIAMCISLMVATTALWIAAQTAGFNFWTVVLGYGILSMIGTYAFGQLLRDVGAFFLIALTDKIEEGWYIEISELNVRGRITAIQWLWVEVAYINENTQKVEEAHIPTGFIMMNILRRVFDKEIELEKTSLTPNANVGARHGLIT